MMELPVTGVLKCPVNINFTKVVVFIDGFGFCKPYGFRLEI